MDTAAASQVSQVPHGELVALEVFTAAVVITFVALSVVAGPVLLLLTMA